MKQITAEWIRKAEADFATAQREFAVEVEPNYDAVCFHSQQAVEKMLKARLQEADIQFRKFMILRFYSMRSSLLSRVGKNCEMIFIR